MRTRLLLVVLLSGAGVAALRSAGAADGPAPPAVAGLIERLGSPSFEERERASRELEAVGPAALDPLRRALASDDPEVRHRADVLVRRLEALALARKVLAPTRVRLVCRDRSLQDVLDDLQRKTGAQVFLQDGGRRLGERRLTLDTGEATLWEALDQVCRKAGLTEPYLEEQAQGALAQRGRADGFNPLVNAQQAQIAQLQAQLALQRQMRMQVQMQLQMANGVSGVRHLPAAQPGPIILADGKRPPLPTFYAGAVRVRALPPDSAAAAVPRRSGERVVLLEATPEPHLPWHGITGVSIDRAIDDRGQHLARVWEAAAVEPNELPPAAIARVRVRAGLPMVNPTAGGAQQQPVLFRRGEKPSKVLKELSGTILAEVQTEPEVILTVDKLLQAVGQTVRAKEGGWIRVTQADNAGGMFLCRCEVEFPPDVIPATLGARAHGRLERGPATTGVNGLHLLDDDGNPVPIYPRHTRVQVNGAGYVWDCAFAAVPGSQQPAKLVFAGSRLVTVAIPFTLTDVPLR